MSKTRTFAPRLFGTTAALLAACSGEPAAPPTASGPLPSAGGSTIEVDAYVAHRDNAVGLPTLSWLTPRHGIPVGSAAKDIALGTLRGLATPYHLSEAALRSATLREVHDAGNGPLIAHFDQQVEGLEVFRTSMQIGMDRGSSPVVATGYLAPAVQPITTAFAIDETAAVAAAFRAMQNNQVVVNQVDRKTSTTDGPYAALTVQGAASTGGTMTGPARSKRLWYPAPGGLLPAYYVELTVGLSDSTDARMCSFVVSAVDGSILFTRELTAADGFTYRVWADKAGRNTPWDSPAGNDFSPHPTGKDDGTAPTAKPSVLVTLQNAPFNFRNDPWLPASATEANGNNVFAYADLVAPDGFSPGDLKVTTTAAGTFDRTIDPMADSTAAMAPAVGTHLFYILNYMHDYFYEVGWNEVSFNSQKDNFGRGGLGGDAIRAEAQDSSGTNNANASTPADGSPARIQMYLWTPSSSQANITTPGPLLGPLQTGTAAYNPASYNVTKDVVLVDDGSGMTSTLGCQPTFANAAALAGKLALIDRGTCSFAIKTKNAQVNGAVGVIIANNLPANMGGGPFGMSGSDPTITIPTIGISQEDGTKIKASLTAGTAVSVHIQGTRAIRDGSIDSGIVAHEWGHTMSNRLIGNASGLSGTQGGGMGEGWSDFVAMLTTVRPEDAMVPANANWNGTYAVGAWATWAIGNNTWYEGIRRYPYSADMTKNPLTFKHIQQGTALPTMPPPAFGADGSSNAEVHSTGEVWQTMLWDCYVALLRDTARYTFEQANLRMRQYLVASLKLTPNQPTILEARDAVLASAYATDEKDFQLFWQAFARRGAGLGAIGPDRSTTDNTGVTESFIVGNDLGIVGLTVDDTVKSCDHDYVLDNGETGKVTVNLRNLGTGDLSATTVKVSTTSPGITISNVAPINAPVIKPYQSAKVTVNVSMSGATGMTPYDLTIEVNDPMLAVKRTLTVTYQGLGNYDDVPATGAIETGDIIDQAWTVANNPDPMLDQTLHWQHEQGPRATGDWHCPDHDAAAEHYLISPPLQVKATGKFTFTVHHRYDWEVDSSVTPAQYYDGSIIELSADAGLTWTDIGDKLTSNGYNTTLVGGMTTNPLGGRKAFGGQSAGFVDMKGNPGYIDTVADLGMAYAGKTVQVRFSGAMDSFTGYSGWFIKEVTFDNIANTPFSTRVADRGMCWQAQGLVVAAKSDMASAISGTLVRMVASVTSMPAMTPDGSQAVTFTWSQVSGPLVTLTNPSASTAQFVAPAVSQDTPLVFQVIGSDGTQQSDPAMVTITIAGTTQPSMPTGSGCSFAGAIPAPAATPILSSLLVAGLALLRRRRTR